MLTTQTLLNPNIFRAYDIRGIVGKTLTEEVVYLIGKALGSIAIKQSEKKLIIGRDGRLSGPMLSNALCKGILATGCDVIDIGLVPTPLLYFATHVLNSRSGVMLTGSHNPADYNGLKIVMNGKSLTEDAITGIYEQIKREECLQGEGHLQTMSVNELYQRYILDHISLKRSLRIVIDAGNGVTGSIAPALFRALGCDVHELYCEVDGHFPNHHPDPSQPENLADLIAAVKKTNADVGLAFDGDGDRLGVVTNQGKIIWPDRLLMLFAKAVLNDTPQAKIIYDVKCTQHLTDVIHECGGEAIMWKTGHSFIKTKLAECDGHLAGEMSGHFFFKDRWFGFDDALYAGARFLQILADTNEDCENVFSKIPESVSTPELKVHVADEEKFALMQKLTEQVNFKDAKDITTIDGLRVNFKEGWGLVRPSNTTPCLVLRFEAVDNTKLSNIQRLFRDWMLSVKPDLVLPF